MARGPCLHPLFPPSCSPAGVERFHSVLPLCRMLYTPWDASSESNISSEWRHMGDFWYLSMWRLSLRNILERCRRCGVWRSVCELGRQLVSSCPGSTRVARSTRGDCLRSTRSFLFSLHSAVALGIRGLRGWAKALRRTWKLTFKCTRWVPPQSNWFYEWSPWNVRVTVLKMMSLFSSSLVYILQKVHWHGSQTVLNCRENHKTP